MGLSKSDIIHISMIGLLLAASAVAITRLSQTPANFQASTQTKVTSPYLSTWE